MRSLAKLWVWLALASPAISATATVASEPVAKTGELFERVVEVLGENFYDRETRARIPALADSLRAAARRTALSDRELVERLLSGLDVSHLALYSKSSFEHMRSELADRRRPTFGLQLVEVEGRYFADWILEGGPADKAGVRRGDRVLTIDGVEPELCSRLDWSTDDAALPDPPIHSLLCKRRDRIVLTLADSRGTRREASIEALPYSGTDAAHASVRLFELGGGAVAGYVHFWFIADRVPSRLLKELVQDGFSECDALLLDLRGRGGYASEVDRILRVLDPDGGPWSRPVVLLTDAGTRSAKEVIAHRLREQGGVIVVGERTAGAVIPATFTDVGPGAVLMYPAFTLGAMTGLLEGQGVEPDIEVAGPLPLVDGTDPILDAALVAARVWCQELRAALKSTRDT